jgi:hypothetical protein
VVRVSRVLNPYSKKEQERILILFRNPLEHSIRLTHDAAPAKASGEVIE